MIDLVVTAVFVIHTALGAVAAGQAPADARTSGRAAVLAAARADKAAHTTAPKRSFVERKLYWYDNQYVLAKIFGGWKGFHVAGGDFPAGAGTKFGAGFDHAFGARALDPDARRGAAIGLLGAYSTNGYTRLAAHVDARGLGGAPIDVRLLGQYYEFPQEDFFGLGRASRKDDRTDYLLDSTEGGVEAQWRPWKFVDLGGGVSYLRPRVGSGTDRRFPSTQAVFGAAGVPGLDARTDFIRTDVSAAFDWRDNPPHPHAGGRYGVRFSNFRDDDLRAFDFRRVEIDVQQYVPLPHRYRLLALRAAAVLTDADAGRDVPFFYQPTLGGSRALRGFREFRFRDRNSIVLTAEYRWEAWWALDAAVFVDAGTVAPAWRSLAFRDFEASYGVGFRVHSNRAVVARLDLAVSREGFVPLLRFEHAF